MTIDNRKSKMENKAAVVTGAGSGMGRAIAMALASEGAGLCLVGRTWKKLEDVESAIGKRTAKTVCCPVDLTVDEQVRDLAERIKSEFGRLDILVHSAGVIRMGGFEAVPVADLDLQYRANVRAPYLLTQAVLPLLRQSKGQVVFMNSTAGLNAGANWGAYSATKGALKMLADSLRAEVNEAGVRVVSVFPGRTATPMQKKICDMEGRAYQPERLLQPEDVASTVVHALSQPRTAEVTDIVIRPMIKPA